MPSKLEEYFLSPGMREWAEMLMSTKTWVSMSPTERTQCFFYTFADSKDIDELRKRLQNDLGILIVSYEHPTEMISNQNSPTCLNLGQILINLSLV